MNHTAYSVASSLQSGQVISQPTDSPFATFLLEEIPGGYKVMAQDDHVNGQVIMGRPLSVPCTYNHFSLRSAYDKDFDGLLDADQFADRKSTRLNSSHSGESRMPSSA